MPYIIETHTPTGRRVQEGTVCAVTARTAVATLDEARTVAYRAVNDRTEFVGSRCGFFAAADVIPESGGTVGPLPDGTVIEVRQIGWWQLRRDASRVKPDAVYMSEAATIRTFNAA
jgi:hypothetical protein